MTKYVISTDSSCDLKADYYALRNVLYAPLTYIINNEELKDNQDDEVTKNFYNAMRDGLVATTSAVNCDQYLQMWEEPLKSNTPILHIAFSSGLSATCQNAFAARDMALEKYKDADIRIIDSLCAAMGQGLFLEYAITMRDDGDSIDQAETWLKANALNICHEFTVADLVYLKRGGRLSSAAAFFGTMLHIKPVMYINDEGKLIPLQKVRGRKNSLKTLMLRLKAYIVNPAEQKVFISHADCIEDAQYLADLIRAEVNPKEIRIGNIGPVIGSHAGPGTVALFYYGSKREAKEV